MSIVDSILQKQAIDQKIGFDQGWRAALEKAAEIALAIDSGRGNEKEIAKSIRSLKRE